MTQQDVLEYVTHPDFGCEVVKTKIKEDGEYFWVRNKKTSSLKIIYPVKNGTYTPIAVADACIVLGIPVPAYAKSAAEHYIKIRNLKDMPTHEKEVTLDDGIAAKIADIVSKGDNKIEG